MPADIHARRNYWISAMEGALFGGAMSFVNTTTLLPNALNSLGSPTWLIALIPILGPIGFLFPPILSAHRVERMAQYKPHVLWCSLMQRLPYALAALLLLVGAQLPLLAIVAVTLAPLASGVFGGMGLTAWQQLLTRCVPRERRQSLFAIRFAVSCSIGMLAGYVVTWVLTTVPGSIGYGVLHGIAFALLMASYAVLSMVHEPVEAKRVPQEQADLITHLRSVPAEVMADRDFVMLLLVRFFRNGMFIMAPFVALHCKEVLGQSAGFLGALLTVQMLGAVVGNAIAALVGDRYGAKVTQLSGLLVCAAMAGLAIVAQGQGQWLGVFGLLGVGSAISDVGGATLGLEMGRQERRSTFLAVGALVNLPGMVVASAISYWFHTRFAMLGITTLISIGCSIVFLLPLKEPHERVAACEADV